MFFLVINSAAAMFCTTCLVFFVSFSFYFLFVPVLFAHYLFWSILLLVSMFEFFFHNFYFYFHLLFQIVLFYHLFALSILFPSLWVTVFLVSCFQASLIHLLSDKNMVLPTIWHPTRNLGFIIIFSQWFKSSSPISSFYGESSTAGLSF